MNTMIANWMRKFLLLPGAALLAGMSLASPANAGGVNWSVGVNSGGYYYPPNVSVQIGNGYQRPARPVYIAPQPIYVAPPAPIYVPQPVYVVPAPGYYHSPPPRHARPSHHYGHRGYHGHRR